MASIQTTIVVSISNAYVLISSSATVWVFLNFVTPNTTWYKAISAGLSTDAKPNVQSVASESKQDH